MRLIRKVSSKEVKRCFVISQLTKVVRRKGVHYKVSSKREFLKKLNSVKHKVLYLSDHQLGTYITNPRRLTAYESSDWYLAIIKISEVGVWTRAGGLPLEWTNRSLKETANYVRKGLSLKTSLAHTRARSAVNNMLAVNVEILQDDKYLLPIVFKGNTGTRGRWRLKYQTKGDIDDGCMRSVSLAISGRNTLKVYFGVPKKK